MTSRTKRRSAGWRIGVVLATVLAGGTWVWADVMRMPGSSFTGELPPLTDEQARSAERMETLVRRLATSPRTIVSDPQRITDTAQLLHDALAGLGLEVERQSFEVDGHTVTNVIGTLTGAEPRAVIVGAHYDTAPGSPGANDNASGVAATLELARHFAGKRFRHTLRFVAFANEEPPFFQGEGMGSYAYAKRCRERGDEVAAMLSLETIGYYSSVPGSQQYPPPFSWFYPSKGNFVAFVGHRASGELAREAIASFRSAAAFPSEGATPPAFVQGVDWSDQWSFWEHGYPRAIMITDTAVFRYPHYHRASDTADRLDYASMARVVTGLVQVVTDLAEPP